MNKFKRKMLCQQVMEPKKKVQDILKELAINDTNQEFSRIKIGD